MRRTARPAMGVIVLTALVLAILAAAGAPAASPRHVARAAAGTVFAPAVVKANPRPAGTGSTANRYTLANGCFAITSGGQTLAGADAPFRMQATALGQYLVYGVHADFLGPAGARLDARGLGAIQLGSSARAVLFAGGQPVARPGRSFRYCTSGAPHSGSAVVFTRSGRVRMIATTASGALAGRLHPGARAPRAAGLARLGRPLGHGLWLGPRLRRGTRIVYRVRAGRIAWVAAVTASGARRVTVIRSDARAAGLR